MVSKNFSGGKPPHPHVCSLRSHLAPQKQGPGYATECTPLCIDTRYGIGEFFVTTTSYKNLKVLNKGNHEHPSFPGPALFHVDEDESVFSYFSQTLISLENSLRSVLFIGSDRDRALINGTKSIFSLQKIYSVRSTLKMTSNANSQPFTI